MWHRCQMQGRKLPSDLLAPLTETVFDPGNTDSLAPQLKRDGYLFFRGVIDPVEVMAARCEVFQRLAEMGEIADPGTGTKTRDLSLARHSIDVLQLLKEKTAGNLGDDEGRLLDALLSDLNQKYQAAND